MTAANLERLSARERLTILVDEGSFREIDGLPVDLRAPAVDIEALDGVIAGFAKVSGRRVGVFSQDSAYKGGSLGVVHLAKLRKTFVRAAELGFPLLGLFDSGGARIQEGVRPLAEVGRLFEVLTKVRTRVPLVFAVMGSVLGGSTYAASFGDFLVMVENEGHVFVWGPGVVSAETGRKVSMEELGGADLHLRRSGVASLRAKDDKDCIEMLKRLLDYLPDNSEKGGRRREWSEPIKKVPDVQYDYNARDLIDSVFDQGSFLELQAEFANNVVAGLARLEGRAVGVVACQPSVNRGFIDVGASTKISRLLTTCNSFRIPVVTFLDSRGPAPGVEHEAGGLIPATAQMLEAYSKRGGRKTTVIVGSAFGGAFVAMASKPLGIDRVYAYPWARIAIMSPESYIEIFAERKLQGLSGDDRRRAMEEMTAQFSSQQRPKAGVDLGYLDGVITPEETRGTLAKALKAGSW